MTYTIKSKIIDWIFENIRLVFLLFLFLVVFGSFALANMQRQGFPDVPVNIATVVVTYPNAPASQVEEEILKPIEVAIENLEDIKEYQTTAYDSAGVAMITFDEKADADEMVAAISDEIDLVDFPDDAFEPEVSGYSVADVGHFIIAVTGPANEWALYESAKTLMSDLEAIDGVKSTKVINPMTPEILITFDEEKLQEVGVERMQVEQMLAFAQFKAPVGSVVEDDKRVSLVLEKSVQSLEDIRNFQIGDGVVLGDVAIIEPRLENNDYYNRIGFRDDDDIDGEFSVQRAGVYSVTIDSDADLLKVSEDVTAFMEEVSEDPALGAELVMMYSQAEETELQIDEITSSLFGQPFDSWGAFAFLGYIFGGMGLVILLLLIFMNARVAIMAALSVPLSLFFASIYLYLADINLNTLVLFSMVLVIGLVVDPTIVFLESMQRYKSQGLSGREAAKKTMETVGAGVLLAVLTNILVFVPFGVVSGFFGEIIKYIPATVVPAMIASMLIPVLFYVPVASRLLSPKKKEVDPENPELTGTWWISKKIGAGIRFLLGKGKARVALRFFVFFFTISLPFAVGGVLIGSGAVEVVQFAGDDDMYQIIINGEIDESYDFEEAVYDYAVPMQELIAEQPEVKKFFYYQQNGNSFTVLVELFQADEREDAGLRTSSELVHDLNEGFDEFSDGIVLEASTTTVGPPTDAYPVRVSLQGDDMEALEAAAEDIVAYLEEQEGVERISNSLDDEKASSSVKFVLDSENPFAQQPAYIYSLVNSRLVEKEVGTIAFGGESFDVYSASANQIEDIEEVKELIVGAVPMGGTVTTITLDDIIASEEQTKSKMIQRIDGSRFVDIAASFEDDVDTNAIQLDLKEYLSKEKLEEYGLEEDALTSTGAMDVMMDSFEELFLALGIAIFLIYILLVSAFRSYLEPFIILFAIPLGLVGVFIASALTSGQLGFLELLGVVTMAGIVVNVTILIIDLANQMKRAGKSPADAISTSIALRFRPIVLTQITALGGLTPLIFLSVFWRGLAAAIVLGIVSSAFLSLVITPILYLWSSTINRNIQNMTRWTAGLFKRKKTPAPPEQTPFMRA